MSNHGNRHTNSGLTDDQRFVTVERTSAQDGPISLNVAVQGNGPLILCIHGWPELWFSWRHQMRYFAPRGYTVAAMDVRGYGGSTKPESIAAYRLTELCADAAAVIDELGNGSAIVFGHDWGAPIAWNTARLYPDKVSAVAGLSVPYRPVGPESSIELWKAVYADKFFYQLYFQQEGIAEAEVSADPLGAIRKIYYAISGDGSGLFLQDKSADAKLLDGLIDPDPFPTWASDADLKVYADAMTAGGWRGPFNRYRAQAFDAADLGARTDLATDLTQPAVFIAGALDAVRNFVPGMDLYADAGAACQDFRGSTIISGAGHWVQQEARKETNEALEQFLRSLH